MDIFIVIKRVFLLLIFNLTLAIGLFSQEKFYVQVHFIHGSRPKKEFKNIEKKWRGGILGGHVGLEIEPNRVLDFKSKGKFHWFAHRKNIHSQFSLKTQAEFWGYFGSDSSVLERTTVKIPISQKQKNALDSLAKSYIFQCPYDYAFLGMRCASASYDVLAEAGVFKKRSRFGVIFKNFYPKKLRKRVLRMARENGWVVLKNGGSKRRVWDVD